MERRNFLKNLGAVAGIIVAPKILTSWGKPVEEIKVFQENKEFSYHRGKPSEVIRVKKIIPPNEPGGDIQIQLMDGYSMWTCSTIAIPISKNYELYRVVFRTPHKSGGDIYTCRPLCVDTYFIEPIPHNTKILEMFPSAHWTNYMKL